MKYIKFEISKFKWIDHEIIDLSKIPQWKIFPLVWLNESWKTTILEAINFFQEEIDDDKKFTYIHKKDLADFSWEITCAATLELDNEDKNLIKSFLKEKHLIAEKELSQFTIIKKLIYKNAKYIKPVRPRIIPLRVKTAKSHTFKPIREQNQQIRNDLAAFLTERLPKVLYFSNFLFDFPKRIYLENIEQLQYSDQEKNTQHIYQDIINDIFSSINSSVNDFLQKRKSGDWWNNGDSASANAILQRVSASLKQKIIAPWSDIFPWPEKSIEINVNNDNIWYYLNTSIGIWSSEFLVSEMSLWFRWFFSFILFTEFRKSRNDESWEYLFLFDEPASNLHEHSQQKLLTVFDRIVNNDKAKIIYSTHSPYLINPKYILNAFVVKDEWRNNIEDEFVYRQNIKAVNYREFVANSNEDYSHFKPILDALDFTTNPFELTNDIIFTEWKHDYYTFKRIKEKYFNDDYEFNFYPWWGVTSYGKVLRDYIANNKNFIWIFDWDDEWKNAKSEYIENISEELKLYLFTLDDIDITFDWRTTEFLFTNEDKLKIQKITFTTDSRYNKAHFNKSIENIFINNIECELSQETLNNFEKIFNFIKWKLEN